MAGSVGEQARRNLELARFVFGNCDDGSLVPEDADWTEERLPLSSLEHVMDGGADGWIEWFGMEIECRKADLADGSTDGCSIHWEAFARHETDEPCVVALDDDGRPQIWDGFHRIGGAFVRGAEDIVAIVGRRRPGHEHAAAPAP